MASLIYAIVVLCSRLLRSVWRHVLKFANAGRGRSVPMVTDPVLLKSATTLAREIRNGKLKSEDVVSAYIRRIDKVEPYINAVAEQRFQNALEEAKAVDVLLATRGMGKEQLAVEKPLLGVPFTVKCLICVGGLPCTAGSLMFKNKVAEEDGDVVNQLKRAGAIVLATTNAPEFGANLETDNYVYGRTNNPYNTSRTCGGSSGGEGALIGAAGSVVGIGNDMGGSVRIPGMYNGIFAHKPSRGVVYNEGSFPVWSNHKEYISTGPMCRYAEDLVTLMNVFTAEEGKALKFNSQVNFKKLKIYYITSIDNIPLAIDVNPEIKEALMKVVSHFQTEHGVKARQANIPLLSESQKLLFYTLFFADPNLWQTVTGGKDKFNPFTEMIRFVCGKSMLTFNTVVSMVNNRIKPFYNKTRSTLYELTIRDLQRSFEALLDEDTILLTPTFPVTAHYHHESMMVMPSLMYTGVYNLLGLPATQCPLGLDSEGLPLGIQVVGRRGNDRLTVAVALELEKAFGGWMQPRKSYLRVNSIN